MFCENCGKQLSDNAKFCKECGAATTATHNEVGGYDNDNLIGWSPHIDNPVFRKSARAYNKRMIIAGLVALLVFPLALGTYGYFDHGGENFYPLIGVGIALGIFSSIWCLQIAMRRIIGPSWDGVVTDKKVTKKRRKKYGGANANGPGNYEWQSYTLYEVVIQKDDGNYYVIGIEDSSFVFDNYAVGDKVRYHGFMEYVEKYDKSNSKFILCAKCGNDNDPHLDNCTHCDNPLLKGARKQR